MKKTMIGMAAVVLLNSCTQVAGWFGNNSDSTNLNSDSSYAAYARDESITAANAYSDLFLDSNAVENYIQRQKLSDSTASAMRSFYRVRNYEYAWFTTQGPTEQARGLWGLYANGSDSSSRISDSTLRDSSGALAKRMDTLLQRDSVMVDSTDSSFVQTELKLTQHLINYAAAHPQHLNKGSIFYLVPAKKMNAMEYADSILNRKKNSSMYAGNQMYSTLKSELSTYYEIAKNGGWDSLQVKSNLKKGTRSADVVTLKKRLQMTKDYNGADTSDQFNDSLAMAVKSFQQRHGLQPNGIVNDSTMQAMNVPVQQRIQQIIVNMNRVLWMPPRTDSNRIEVNIPSQMLYAYADSGRVFEMPVIVGKEGTGTVMFSSAINKIVFNPSWNIPQSIVRDEIMPKMKADASYLKKNHIEQVNGNDSIPQLRQLPGADNPLGKVKFLFPNTHDIYLHDTPNKSDFAKNDRALSHGCIRVGDAERLAEYLLRNQPDWTPEKIRSAMNGDKEQTVELKTDEPVNINYLTVWVDKDGQVNFRPDIYHNDEEAMNRLFTPGT